MTTQPELPLDRIKREWIELAEERFGWSRRHLSETFTIDDVLKHTGRPPEPNWAGVLMNNLRVRYKLVSAGYVRTTRKERNFSVIKLWRMP